MTSIGEHAESTASPSVLLKAFDVLGSFSQSRRVLTLSELARRSGLPKSTVHRVLSMLIDLRAVERVDLGYRMGLRMFAMGSCSSEVALRDLALPHLEQLRRVTGQTVHLAVADGTDVVYLEKLSGPRMAATPAVVGGRLPATTTGVGKALLAFGAGYFDPTAPLERRTTMSIAHPESVLAALAEIKRTGLAWDREEAVSGLACVAVPVVVGSQAVAAVSVAYPAQLGSGQALVHPLREAAGSIARAMAASKDVVGLAGR